MKTFEHSGNLGDIIYSLPTIIALGGGVLYIGDGKVVGIDESAPKAGSMTTDMISQIIELLKTQPYLANVKPYKGEAVDYYLDKFREYVLDEIKGDIRWLEHLAYWHLETFRVKFRLSTSWLYNIEPFYANDIIIANTGRYIKYSKRLNWQALKGFEDKCLFVGFDKEYQKFKMDTGLNIEKCSAVSILKFAQIIKGCKLFIGNETLGFALAEALKHPRVLEASHYASHALPQSTNGYLKLNKNLIKRALSGKKTILLHPEIEKIIAHTRGLFFHVAANKKPYYLFCKKVIRKYFPASVKLKRMFIP